MNTFTKGDKSILPYILAILIGIWFSQINIKFQIVSFVMLIIISFMIFFFVVPKIALLFLFFVRPIIDLYWNKPIPGFKNPLYLIGGLVVILIILFLLMRKIYLLEIPYSNLVILFLLTLFLTLSLTAFTTPELRFGTLEVFLRIINGFLFFLIIPFIFKTKKDINRLINILLLSTIIPLLISLYVWFKGNPGIFGGYFTGGEEIGRGVILQYRGLSRLSGLYQGTFNIAFYSLLVLFLGLFKLQYLENPKWRKLLLIYMVMSLFPLFQTYLRAGWGMVFVGLGIWFFLKKKKSYWIVLIGGTILFFFFSMTARQRFVDEVAFLTGKGSFEHVGSGRGSEIIDHINMYIHQFSPVEKIFGGIGAIRRPENQIIHLLINFGILGLLSALIMVGGIAWGLLKSFKKQAENFYKDFALLAFILHTTFLLAWIGGTPLFWINSQWVIWSIIGIALYQTKLSEQLSHQKNKKLYGI